MSQFSEAVKNEALSVVGGYLSPAQQRGHRHIEPSVPTDLTSRLPDNLTEVAVRNAVAGVYERNGRQEAGKVLDVYSADALLRGDAMLDRLDLVGTPDGNVYERLDAIKSVLDLNRRLEGKDDFSNGLLGVMSDYWNQMPIFFSDLTTAFDVMANQYDGHPKLGKFRNWLTYDVREGILDVAEELVAKYGVPFEEGIHTSEFGLKKHGERRVLTGVSTEEFMTALCSANKYLADRGYWSGHIDHFKVGDGAENWKVALMKARDATLQGERKSRARPSQIAVLP